jgi:hypothetical protein
MHALMLLASPFFVRSQGSPLNDDLYGRKRVENTVSRFRTPFTLLQVVQAYF